MQVKVWARLDCASALWVFPKISFQI